jgi:integrase/recombinase XerD
MKTLKEHILEKHTKHAMYGYMHPIRHFIAYMGETEAKQATYRQIVDYLNVLRAGGNRAKTVNNHLYAIKIYFQWLLETGQRDDHPCRDFYLKDQIDRSIHIEKLYSQKELEEIANSFISHDVLNRNRDKIILSLLIHQALTAYEIINLKVSDVDLQKGTLNVQGSVKTTPRILPLKSEQIMLLHDYLTHCRPVFARKNKKPDTADMESLILSRLGTKMVFTSLACIFKHPLSNGMKVTAQKIRQSVIVQMVKNGNDLRIIQAFTGHRHVSSIEAYKQTGLEDLRNLIQRLHPLQ